MQTTVNLRQAVLDNLRFDANGRLALAKLSETGASGTCLSAVLDLGGAKAVTLNRVAQWITPQRWLKHPGNPVYGSAQSGAWDTWCNGVSIVRNPDGRSYKMFYAGRKGAGIGFAEADIANPLAWKENPLSPVLRPRADNWEGDMINQPRVVKVTDTHWRMYYTGWGLQGVPGTAWAMGIAESQDAGLTWARRSDDPFFPRGDADSADGGGACVPQVLHINGLWHMWYTAVKVMPERQSIHICYATSKDGVVWDKHPGNPVLTDDFATGPSRNVISRCFVRHTDGVFQMWYSHAKPDYRIRYAESLDGINWERSPLPLALDASPAPAWDDQMVEYPEVDLADGQWRLWFCGNGFGNVGFALGVVETGVEFELRSGPTPEPGAAWSRWSPVRRGVPAALTGRHAQVRARLWSRAADFGPALVGISLTPAAGC